MPRAVEHIEADLGNCYVFDIVDKAIRDAEEQRDHWGATEAEKALATTALEYLQATRTGLQRVAHAIAQQTVECEAAEARMAALFEASNVVAFPRERTPAGKVEAALAASLGPEDAA